MRHMARPGIDLQVGKRSRTRSISARPSSMPSMATTRNARWPPRRLEQVDAGGVAIEDEAELAQELDLVGIMIQHSHTQALRIQQAPDDLAEAAEPGDQHGVVLWWDHIVLARRQPRQPGASSRS